MGQKLAIYESVPLICLQTTRGGLFNSQLLTVRSYDATHIEVEDAESGQTYSLTHEWCRLHTRSSHAVTISSCQKRRRWEQVLGSLEKMRRSKLQPTVISYNAAISSCENRSAGA